MTSIEWTQQTWNPTTGCDRTSPGCDHCYALTLAGRLKAMGQAKYQNDGDPATSGPGFALTLHPDTLDVPLRRRKPTTYFVNSMSDLFHPDVTDDFVAQVFAVMASTPRHTYQILTKRPQWMAHWMRPDWYDEDRHINRRGTVQNHVDFRVARTQIGLRHFTWPLPNVWLGTSIENDRYSYRANHLRNTPAAVRFLSLEPLLGPLPTLNLNLIDWVIVGGESGPGARPMHPDWARDVRDRCGAANIPFFFKQWGAWMPEGQGPHPTGEAFWSRDHVDPSGGFRYCNGSFPAFRVGKKNAGRLLDGRTWDEMPERGGR